MPNETLTARVYPATIAEKWRALGILGKSLDKQYGSQTFQRMGDLVGKPIPSWSTELPSLDRYVLGCGGLPKGRMIELYGPESSGKTAIALHIIGCVQRAGGLAAFIDAEYAFDPTFASKLRVNVNDLLISQPDYGEQGIEILEALLKARVPDIVVVDSVDALVPKAELDGEVGDANMGLKARLMAQSCRRLCALISESGIPVIFINQIRENLGVMFGNPETTTGGRALKFYSSIRVEVRRPAKANICEGEAIIGHQLRVKCTKNKVALPFRESVIKLLYDTGIDVADDVINYALKIGVLEGSAWLTFKGNEKKYRRTDLEGNEAQTALRTAINKFHLERSENHAKETGK